MGKTNGIAEKDDILVARLRAKGAIIFGKLNMHEIGIGTDGINPNFGVTRNPWSIGLNRDTGGSSSASAAAVAAGLFPLAVAADGGGSTRIPSGNLPPLLLILPEKRACVNSPLWSGWISCLVRKSSFSTRRSMVKWKNGFSVFHS